MSSHAVESTDGSQIGNNLVFNTGVAAATVSSWLHPGNCHMNTFTFIMTAGL